MSTKKQKERKKKQRERKIRKELLSKRAKLTLAAQEQRELFRLQHKFRNKLTPYVNPPTEEQVKLQLEHNLEILKALEEEYDKEMKNRQEVNKQLEAEGYIDLKSKMDAVSEQFKNAEKDI